jgi:hypothetical protein
MFDSSHKGLLSFRDMVRLFKYTSLYIKYNYKNKDMIGLTEFNWGYENIHDPLHLASSEIAAMSELRDYANTKLFEFNLKAFLSIFAFNDAFSDFLTPN